MKRKYIHRHVWCVLVLVLFVVSCVSLGNSQSDMSSASRYISEEAEVLASLQSEYIIRQQAAAHLPIIAFKAYQWDFTMLYVANANDFMII